MKKPRRRIENDTAACCSTVRELRPEGVPCSLLWKVSGAVSRSPEPAKTGQKQM